MTISAEMIHVEKIIKTTKILTNMKKAALRISTIVFLGVSLLWLQSHLSSEKNLSDIQLANIEALTNTEEPCNNYNGYRRILEGNEKIYDCCYKEQTGKGKGDCKRW